MKKIANSLFQFALPFLLVGIAIDGYGYDQPPTVVTDIDTTLCAGQTITIGSETFDQSGVYELVLQDQSGNDSAFIVLSLEVLPEIISEETVATCLGDSLEFGGQTYTFDTTLTTIFTSVLGCDSTVVSQLIFEPLPLFQNEYADQVCVGDTLSLVWGRDFGLEGQDAYVFTSDETLLIPDGTGDFVSSFVNVNGFPPGLSITDIDQIKSICVTIEHSWMRDLQIELITPDGQNLVLQSQVPAGGEVFLGIPNENDDSDIPIPGTGFTYCWTPESGNLTWTEYADIFGPGTLPEGDYTPSESLTNLLGGPFNGDWTLQIEDRWALDNGYLFSWSITFDVDGVASPDSEVAGRGWEETIGGALTQNMDTLEVILDTPGEYDFSYMVTDTAGCVGELSYSIAVVEQFEDYFYIEICEGESFDLDGQVITETGIYQQETIGSNGSCDTLNIFEIVVLTEITTIVEETTCFEEEAGSFTNIFTSAGGCDSIVIREVVWTPFDLDYDITIVADTCQTGTGQITVTWEDGQEILPNLTGGTYTVTVGDANGCIDFQEVTVPTEVIIPIAGFDVDDSALPQVTFTNQSLDADSYIWDFGDGTTTSAVSPVHEYATPGIYEVCLTAFNICTSSTTCQTVNTLQGGSPFQIEIGEGEGLPGTELSLPFRFMTDDVLGGLEGTILFTNPFVSAFDGLTLGPDVPEGQIEFLASPDGQVINFTFTSQNPNGSPLAAGDTLFFLNVALAGGGGQSTLVLLQNPEGYRYVDGNSIPEEVTTDVGEISIISLAEGLSGKITTTPIHSPSNAPIFLAEVRVTREPDMSFDTTVLTPPNGAYNPGPLTEGTYRVTPAKDDDAPNGIATNDLIQLVRHIGEVELLEEPYDLIAGDVECDADVDQDDLTALFDLLLSGGTTFDNCPSWAFIPTTYSFPDPENPYDFPMDQEVELTSQQVVDNVDFYGIKKGDLTRNASPISIVPVTQDSIIFLLNNGMAEAGETISLSFSPTQFEGVLGFQFAVDYDTDRFQFLEVTDVTLPGSGATFGVMESEPGTVRVIWFSPSGTGVDVDPGTSVFTLTFAVEQMVDDWSPYFELNADALNPEGYISTDPNEPSLPVVIQFDEVTSLVPVGSNELVLYRPMPNPFKDQTTVRFQLPVATSTQLLVRDVQGQVLWYESATLAHGIHERTISGLDAGIYFFTLRTPSGQWHQKMICIR
jgi:PKD repeat protein/subtilisin-like proprotein convertase family protein